MPMDPKYIALEFDAVEKRGGGRVPQKMAKSRYGQGISPYPRGIHPNLLKHKQEKTMAAVEAKITQVKRKFPERE